MRSVKVAASTVVRRAIRELIAQVIGSVGGDPIREADPPLVAVQGLDLGPARALARLKPSITTGGVKSRPDPTTTAHQRRVIISATRPSIKPVGAAAVATTTIIEKAAKATRKTIIATSSRRVRMSMMVIGVMAMVRDRCPLMARKLHVRLPRTLLGRPLRSHHVTSNNIRSNAPNDLSLGGPAKSRAKILKFD